MSTNLKKIALIALCAVVIVGSLGFSFSFADSYTLTTGFNDCGMSETVIVPYPTTGISGAYLTTTDSVAGKSIRIQVYFDTVQNSGTIFLTNSGDNLNITFSEFENCALYYGGPRVNLTTNTDYCAFTITYNDNYVPRDTQIGNDYFTGICFDLTPYISNPKPSSSYRFEFSGDFFGPITMPLDFGLYPGQALVIEGACEISERSYYINNSWDFSSNGSMRVNGSSERLLAFGNIRDGFSPDQNLSKDQLIQWEAVNANVLGTASNYEYYAGDLVSLSSGSAFVVTYPLYYGVGKTPNDITFENAVSLIGHMDLSYYSAPNYYVVPMECLASWSSQGDLSYYSVFRPNSSESTGEITEDENGVHISPGDIPSGGANAGQPPVSEETNIFGLLSRFVNQIVGLITNASHSISQLISAGSGFMQNLAGLFTWLPQPVYTCLVSALIIAVSVGVFKLLF